MPVESQPAFDFGGPLPEPVIERVVEPGCCAECYCPLIDHVPGFGCMTITGWESTGAPIMCPCNAGELLDDNKVWKLLDDGRSKRRRRKEVVDKAP